MGAITARPAVSAAALSLQPFMSSAMRTNGNRMEMRAVIEGLHAREPHAPLKVRLRSNSIYMLSGMKKWMRGWHAAGWRRKKGRLQNADLRRKLHRLASRFDLSYEYVPGHRRDPRIEMCDRMAARAAGAHPTA